MSKEVRKSLAPGRHLSQPDVVAADPDERILSNPYIAGKLVPSDPIGIYHLVLKPGDAGPLPVPPKDLWEGYGQDDKTYLDSGRRHTSAMIEILERAGCAPGSLSRVLDLGCAAGRMVRFFPRHDRAEIWGVDINAKHIAWCQSHLSPPLLFATVTTMPHLPFEDGYFDLIYCGSVFTHISNDLADMWLLELRRVLRTGGLLYVTVQDKTSMQTLLANAGPASGRSVPTELSWEKPDGEPGTSSAGTYWISEFNNTIDFSELDFACFSFSWDGCLNVFYDREYLVDKWSRLVELVSVTPGAYGCQTALLWRKVVSAR
jgi:SAM-dependent methyltransferase